jgi:hypothetical protein
MYKSIIGFCPNSSCHLILIRQLTFYKKYLFTNSHNIRRENISWDAAPRIPLKADHVSEGHDVYIFGVDEQIKRGISCCLLCAGSPTDLHINTELFYYFSFIYEAGVDPSTLLLWPFIGLLNQHWMIDVDYCRTISGMNEWQVKPKCSEET